MNAHDVVGWLHPETEATLCLECALRRDEAGVRGFPQDSLTPIFGDAEGLAQMVCSHCGGIVTDNFARNLWERVSELEEDLTEERELAEESISPDDLAAFLRHLHDRDGHGYPLTNCPDCEALRNAVGE